MDSTPFDIWRKERRLFKLFFNGASKDNPGAAGGGGVIINLEEHKEITCSWSIDFGTNNQAEAYGSLQGLKQIQTLKVNKALIFGDSMLIIQAMIVPTQISDPKLVRILQRIKLLSYSFRSLQYFHILQELKKIRGD